MKNVLVVCDLLVVSLFWGNGVFISANEVDLDQSIPLYITNYHRVRRNKQSCDYLIY